MAETNKKTCYNCGYKDSVPGSAHSQCKFNWGEFKLNPPKADPYGGKKGWYNFPFNFDPVWQEEECPAHSPEKDPSKVIEFSPLENIFSILKR